MLNYDCQHEGGILKLVSLFKLLVKCLGLYTTYGAGNKRLHHSRQSSAVTEVPSEVCANKHSFNRFLIHTFGTKAHLRVKFSESSLIVLFIKLQTFFSQEVTLTFD